MYTILISYVDSKAELHNPSNLLVLVDLTLNTEIRCLYSTCCKTVAHLSMLFPEVNFKNQWGAFSLFIAVFFATQIIGGAKELVFLL